MATFCPPVMPMGYMMMPHGMMPPGMMPMGFQAYPVPVPEFMTRSKPAAKAQSPAQASPNDMTKGPLVFRLLPVVFSFVVFILALLALFAGNKPGILESYDILTVNISYLPTNQSRRGSLLFLGNECHSSGLLAKWCEGMDAAAGIANSTSAVLNHETQQAVPHNQTKKANDGDADQALPAKDRRLHPDFYALYPLAVCEGIFHKDGARMNTECHPLFSTGADTGTSIPALLIDALNHHKDDNDNDGDGKSTTETANPFPGALSATLAGLNSLCKAIGFMLSIASGLAGLALIASVCVVTVSSKTEPGGSTSYTCGVWTNLVLSGFSFFFLVLAGLVGSAGGQVNEGNVNHQGKDVDVSAVAGAAWVALEWAAVAAMGVVLVYWGIRAVKLRQAKKAEAAKAAAEQEAEELHEAPFHAVPMSGMPRMRMVYA
ncbi:hypothetical protein VTJ83DRAFT_727 [Remersonia thermophila]|uniref:Uncharacterized protein n=1 Tax=Remersonia thermophila TaxID=72144 RepID=A0ABR4DMR2_9PEZI